MLWNGGAESIAVRPNLVCGIKEGLSEEVTAKRDLKGTEEFIKYENLK